MAQTLADSLLAGTFSGDSIRARGQQIQEALLKHSGYVHEANFKSIHPGDLRFLFQLYDGAFFEGRFAEALGDRRLDFRLSPRMTKAAGTTKCVRNRLTGRVHYEITIASSLLFDGFGEGDRGVTACGLECPTRLHALQRIFEHELIHLGEQLCWAASNCAAPRFQGIASRLFRHAAHTHGLITRRERAAGTGIHVGSPVTFQFEGRRLTGRVNRITKRASVLVADPTGALFSDGVRYLTYYVPIASLVPVATPRLELAAHANA